MFGSGGGGKGGGGGGDGCGGQLQTPHAHLSAGLRSAFAQPQCTCSYPLILRRAVCSVTCQCGFGRAGGRAKRTSHPSQAATVGADVAYLAAGNALGRPSYWPVSSAHALPRPCPPPARPSRCSRLAQGLWLTNRFSLCVQRGCLAESRVSPPHTGRENSGNDYEFRQPHN
jgi:hypothetical protein